MTRRFSDFEWLQKQLQDNEYYKGLIIPPLPEKKFLGNLDNQFIDKRREDLENFLRVIGKHQRLKFDPQLKEFLINTDFDKYRTNPTAYERVMACVEYLPSVKNLTFQSISDAVQTSIVTVKNELQTIEEPRDLRPDVPGFEGDYFSVKQVEVEQWLTVLTNTLTCLKK